MLHVTVDGNDTTVTRLAASEYGKHARSATAKDAVQSSLMSSFRAQGVKVEQVLQARQWALATLQGNRPPQEDHETLRMMRLAWSLASARKDSPADAQTKADSQTLPPSRFSSDTCSITSCSTSDDDDDDLDVHLHGDSAAKYFTALHHPLAKQSMDMNDHDGCYSTIKPLTSHSDTSSMSSPKHSHDSMDDWLDDASTSIRASSWSTAMQSDSSLDAVAGCDDNDDDTATYIDAVTSFLHRIDAGNSTRVHTDDTVDSQMSSSSDSMMMCTAEEQTIEIQEAHYRPIVTVVSPASAPLQWRQRGRCRQYTESCRPTTRSDVWQQSSPANGPPSRILLPLSPPAPRPDDVLSTSWHSEKQSPWHHTAATPTTTCSSLSSSSQSSAASSFLSLRDSPSPQSVLLDPSDVEL